MILEDVNIYREKNDVNDVSGGYDLKDHDIYDHPDLSIHINVELIEEFRPIENGGDPKYFMLFMASGRTLIVGYQDAMDIMRHYDKSDTNEDIHGPKKNIVISKPFINIYTMQVCALKGVSDKEILNFCNKEADSGTEKGWTTVIRQGEGKPVQCNEYRNREHILVTC